MADERSLIMSRSQLQQNVSRPQSGFGIVTALFMVTILSLLGGYLLYNANIQKSKSTLDLRAAKAVQAATTGIQWAAWQVNRSASSNSCPNGGVPLDLTLTGNLKDFRVHIECTISNVSNKIDSSSVKTFDITATASSTDATANDYVERQFKAKIEKP